MTRLWAVFQRIVQWTAFSYALAALIAACVYIWTPSADVRDWALAAGAAGALGVLLISIILLRWTRTLTGRMILCVATTAAYVALALFGFGEVATWTTRQRVLATPAAKLHPLGRHIIVGYRKAEELQTLIAHGAVGGVFITARNTAGLSADALAAEVAGFQATARQHGLAPLIIATDQEGGMIARLSPPLARPPALASLVTGTDDTSGRVRAAAIAAGRDLADVGVTLNFAPVVDLDFGLRNPDDRHSRIGERAISTDAKIVAAAASDYCAGLASQNVLCTLKHFPGLGRVAADTHVSAATLTAPRADLEARDWQPFRAVIANGDAAVMVGHATATALDPSRPASTSPRVIDVLRRDWGFQGLIVTDDLTMAATVTSAGGVGGAAVAALGAGVDLLLVSWDTDQVYAVLDALLRARASGYIEAGMLRQSAERLERRWSKTDARYTGTTQSAPLR